MKIPAENKKPVLTPDFCVVGAGSGGLSFAAGAAGMGASVVLVEADKMGGDCLNSGCVPSKSLIYAAKSYNNIVKSNKFCSGKVTGRLDYKKVHKHIHNVIASIAPNDSIERFEGLGVTVIKGKGSFLDNETLKVGGNIIKAKRYVLATGSRPFIPPIEGIDAVQYHTNETIFDIKSLPKSMVIIGGGPIGIEMAQSFSRLGSRVIVLEAFRVLPKDDSDMVEQLKVILSGEGVVIREHVKVNSVKKTARMTEVVIEDEQGVQSTIKTNALVVAAGRRPNISDLNLDAAGIEHTTYGIVVDKFMRSSNKKVFAIGDCIGGYQFTHVAGYHAGLVLKNSIFRMRSTIKTIQIPWVTYTDPELAHVGFTQEELISLNTDHRVLESDFADNDRAKAETEDIGGIKIYVTPRGGILGATILGHNAGELILPWVIAIQKELNISAMASVIAPYPTFSEISKKTAGSFFKDKIFGSRMKKIVRMITKYTF